MSRPRLESGGEIGETGVRGLGRPTPAGLGAGLAVCGLVLALLSSPGPAFADRKYYNGRGLKPFAEGYRFFELEYWGDARAKMEEALAEDPENRPDEWARVDGTFYEPYIPSYYLSIAVCQSRGGPCRTDAEVWEMIKDDTRPYIRQMYKRRCDEECRIDGSTIVELEPR